MTLWRNVVHCRRNWQHYDEKWLLSAETFALFLDYRAEYRIVEIDCNIAECNMQYRPCDIPKTTVKQCKGYVEHLTQVSPNSRDKKATVSQLAWKTSDQKDLRAAVSVKIEGMLCRAESTDVVTAEMHRKSNGSEINLCHLRLSGFGARRVKIARREWNIAQTLNIL